MIRPFERGDAHASAALLREANPHWLQTEPGLLHELESQPDRARGRWLVAEDGEEVVGWAEASLKWQVATPDIADAWVAVRPDREGRGFGGKLFEQAEAHLREQGARKLSSHAVAGSRGERFAVERGFTVARREQLFDLDLRRADLPRTPLPAGAELVPLAALGDRVRELYALFQTVEAGIPSDEPWTGSSFDEWRREMWDKPDLDPETSIVALVDGRAAATSWLLVAGRFAEVEVTGTLPELRRRGLARACKIESLRRAAATGVERVVTGTDAENEGMLALNDELGFRRTDIELELAKPLD